MWIDELRAYKDREDLVIGELADLADRFTAAMGLRQERHKVSSSLDPRNIRYYTSEGLLDSPLGRGRSTSGAMSVYGYRHLLQLLAIKKLQAGYLPIKKIGAILRELADDDLEALLLDQAMSGDKQVMLLTQSVTAPPGLLESPAMDYLADESATEGRREDSSHSKAKKRAAPPAALGAAFSPPASAAPAPPPPVAAAAPRPPAAAAPAPSPSQPAAWQRFTVHDGVELNLRSDLQVQSEADVKGLLGSMERMLRAILRPPRNS